MIHFTLLRFFFIWGFTLSITAGELILSKSNDKMFRFDYILVSLFSLVVFALFVP